MASMRLIMIMVERLFKREWAYTSTVDGSSAQAFYLPFGPTLGWYRAGYGGG